MKFRSNKVRVWDGHWFGYEFAWLADRAKQQRFMDAMKNSIPVRTWDPQSKIWWVPDIYTHIVEAIAVEYGTLREDQLTDVRAFRARTNEAGTKSVKAALSTLGLLPGVPLALVQRTWAYWESALTAVPAMTLELEKKRDAFNFLVDYYSRNEPNPVTLAEILARET